MTTQQQTNESIFPTFEEMAEILIDDIIRELPGMFHRFESPDKEV